MSGLGTITTHQATGVAVVRIAGIEGTPTQETETITQQEDTGSPQVTLLVTIPAPTIRESTIHPTQVVPITI
jgi:hypothetical protein